jgi:hypothetical protein
MNNTTRGAKPEKATTKRKAAGGCNPTATIKKHNANIAPGCNKRHTTRRRCATFHATPELLGPVLENTMESAGNLPDSEVFSRPESFGFGRDGLVRKAGRMADSMFSTSRPPVALEKAASGLQSQSGAETMTKVISLASRKAGRVTATPAITAKPALGIIERQQAIENALSLALYYIRQNESPRNIHAATVKAVRAASMLKQACVESQTAQGRV